MEPVDEKLLKEKNRIEREESKIEESEDLKLTEEAEVELKEVEVLELVRIEVPTDVEILGDEEIRKIYFMGNPPQYVMLSQQAGISIGFNYTENPVSNESIPKWPGVAKKIFERIGPNAKVYQSTVTQAGEYNVASLEVVTSGLDGGIYSLNFYASIKGNLLIGFISFPSKDIPKKKELALKIRDTFKVLQEE